MLGVRLTVVGDEMEAAAICGLLMERARELIKPDTP